MKGAPSWAWFAIGFFAIALLGRCSKDNTDPTDGVSGMELYTDARTGCQYLGTGFSALTPRLDSDGKQICTGAK